jgi:hypothetical protein
MIRYVVFLLIWCSSASAQNRLDRYLSQRELAFEQFKNSEINAVSEAAHQKALDAAASMLQTILHPPTRSSSADPFVSNISSFFGEIGSDQIDGLTSTTGPVALYSNLSLLEHYKYLPKACRKMELKCVLDGALGTRVFGGNVALTPTGFDVAHRMRGVQIKTLLVLAAQDIGPFPPNALTTYVTDGHRFIALFSQIKLPDLSACSKRWAQAEVEFSKHPIDHRMQLEERAFQAYLRCYWSEVHQVAAQATRTKLEQAIRAEQVRALKEFERWR